MNSYDLFLKIEEFYLKRDKDPDSDLMKEEFLCGISTRSHWCGSVDDYSPAEFALTFDNIGMGDYQIRGDLDENLKPYNAWMYFYDDEEDKWYEISDNSEHMKKVFDWFSKQYIYEDAV